MMMSAWLPRKCWSIASRALKNYLRPLNKTLARVLDGASLAVTIRGRVLIAFVAMSIITGALGSYMSAAIGRPGELVAMTYDRSLMSINYARAAAADFAAMEAAGARRWSVTEPAAASEIDRIIEALEATLTEDLAIAGQRAQSVRAAGAAEAAKAAVASWSKQRRQQSREIGVQEGFERLKPFAERVSQQIDLLINCTAGNGFTYRQRALAAVSQNLLLAVAATALALVFSALMAWAKSRYIARAVAAASSVAENIASGRLECEVPRESRDELGNQLGAMSLMRDNIKAMMEREVGMRQTAQIRLADALESSSEGIVVMSAEGRVTLANSQAKEFFGPSLYEPGWLQTLRLIDTETVTAGQAAPLFHGGPLSADQTGEVRLPDGRWLRACQSATSEGGYIAIFSNITVLKEQREKLKAANDLLDAALDNISQGLAVFNREHRLMMVNRRFCEIFEVSQIEAIIGIDTNGLDRASGAGAEANADLRKLLAKERRRAGQATVGPRFLQLSGGRIIAVNRQPLPDGGWVSTYEDVTVQRRAEAQVSYLARHDALTGLTNRIVLADRIQHEIGRIGRTGKTFAVLCLDLDQFKPINDSFGHPAGDFVLRSVAERLRACVRATDTVSRLGGDEFAILLQDLRKSDDVDAICARIIKDLSAPYLIDGQPASIGVSIGVSIAPHDGDDYERLLKNADIALYLSKSEGRGTWRYFEAEMDQRLQARRAKEIDMRRALEEDQFEVFYQPLRDLERSAVAGFEALLRWNHPERGTVSPAEFIPIAEEIGFIVPLGNWVMQRACADAMTWPPHVKVAVNVSAAQFRHDSLVETVKRVLRETGLSPGRLELEINGSVLLAGTSEITATLYGLRDLGIEISIATAFAGQRVANALTSPPHFNPGRHAEDRVATAAAPSRLEARRWRLAARLDLRSRRESPRSRTTRASARVPRRNLQSWCAPRRGRPFQAPDAAAAPAPPPPR